MQKSMETARAQGMQKLKEKAEVLADLADRDLGKIVSLNESSYPTNWPIMPMAKAEMADSAQLQPWKMEVIYTLNAVFELK